MPVCRGQPRRRAVAEGSPPVSAGLARFDRTTVAVPSRGGAGGGRAPGRPGPTPGWRPPAATGRGAPGHRQHPAFAPRASQARSPSSLIREPEVPRQATRRPPELRESEVAGRKSLVMPGTCPRVQVAPSGVRVQHVDVVAPHAAP